MLKRFLKVGCIALGALVAMNCEGMKGSVNNALTPRQQAFIGKIMKFNKLAQNDIKRSIDEFLIMKHRSEEDTDEQAKTKAEQAVKKIVEDLKALAKVKEGNGPGTLRALVKNKGLDGKELDDKAVVPDNQIDQLLNNNQDRIHLIAQIIDAIGRNASGGIAYFDNSDRKLGSIDNDAFTETIPVFVVRYILNEPVKGHMFTKCFNHPIYRDDSNNVNHSSVFEWTALDLFTQFMERYPNIKFSLPSNSMQGLNEEGYWTSFSVDGKYAYPAYKGLNLLNFLIVCNGFDNVYEARAFLTAWNWMEMPFDQPISKFRGKDKKQANEFAGHTPLTLAVKKLAVMILKESDQTDLNKAVPVYLEIIKYVADHLDEGLAAFNTPIPGFRPNNIKNDRTVAEGYSDFLVWLVTDAWMKGKVTGKVLKDAFELGMYLRGKQLIEENINNKFIDQAWNIINRKGWKETYPGLAAK